jgi:hypothetical protein
MVSLLEKLLSDGSVLEIVISKLRRFQYAAG